MGAGGACGARKKEQAAFCCMHAWGVCEEPGANVCVPRVCAQSCSSVHGALQGWAPQGRSRQPAPVGSGYRVLSWVLGSRLGAGFWCWVPGSGLTHTGWAVSVGLSPPPSSPFLHCRKLYWTDGDNISVANMDGSNRTLLFTNQKGPVGTDVPLRRPEPGGSHLLCQHRPPLLMVSILLTSLLPHLQVWPLITPRANCTGSAPAMAPSTDATWMAATWR